MTDAASGSVTHRAAKQARSVMMPREAGILAALILSRIVFAPSRTVVMLPNLLNLPRRISLLGVLTIGATYVLIISEVDLSVDSLYGFAGMLDDMLVLQGIPELTAIAITLGTLYLVRGATLVMSDGMPVSLQPGSPFQVVAATLASGEAHCAVEME